MSENTDQAIATLHGIAAAGGSKIARYDTEVTVRLGDLRAALGAHAKAIADSRQSNELAVHWIGVADEQKAELDRQRALADLAMAAAKDDRAVTAELCEYLGVDIDAASLAAGAVLVRVLEIIERSAQMEAAIAACKVVAARDRTGGIGSDAPCLRDLFESVGYATPPSATMRNIYDEIAQPNADADAGIRANPASYAPGSLAESLAGVPGRPEKPKAAMTFGELKAALAAMTAEQLAMPVLWCGEERGGEIQRVDVLDEEHIVVDARDGMEPASVYADDTEALAEVTARWPAGTPMLCTDGC